MSEIVTAAELDLLRESCSLDLIGVADIGGVRDRICGLPENTVAGLPFAIVGAMKVSSAVLDTLEDGPNVLYYHHYRQLNFHLDRAALGLAREMERRGYLAIPIAASQVVDWGSMRGHVSHKELGRLAGLGWLGINNLLVTPDFGARVRLVSVLTNMPLAPGRPVAGGCGDCRRCLTVCPAGAIHEDPAGFDHMACYQQLKEFTKSRRIGQYICGLCVKACAGQSGGSDRGGGT